MHPIQESAPTIGRIWKLIEETNRIVQEVAAMVMGEEAQQYAQSQGLYGSAKAERA
ncbi:hypothetical protein [Candidatus Symbiobacter mobilis]|uniref:Uncharacterized protein n=1 Tax=Candidatus Symbiobacter mobilis CR TaxID=946483 RepID=U5N9I8_9BURK|nr:hypothetical protein [Candidatus Symbiobacter mobilis]AGX88072.1 hypothetical protein Cenrod_1999 [Candidatus Symbiobacter mobilis CR]